MLFLHGQDIEDKLNFLLKIYKIAKSKYIMAQKRDDYEDEDDSDNKTFAVDKLTTITAISFVILAELFFYFLKIKTNADFGWVQIVFGIIIGLVMALFLVWIRFIMASNKYMGGLISVAGIIAVAYALTRKYQGTYTTIFLSIGILLALFYTFFYFIKSNKK